MDWTRHFRGLEARVGVLLLMGALVFACALAHADSRRIVITQDRDENINVSVDPSLMPDANIRREAGRMIIELPDRAFPKGFEPGTLRVDSGSKEFVKVGRSGSATTVIIDSGQVFLSIQDLSPPPRKVGPAPAVPADVAREMAEPPAPAVRPEPQKVIAPPKTSQPRAVDPKPEPTAAQKPEQAMPPPQAAAKQPEPVPRKKQEAEPGSKPEKKPAESMPEKEAQSRPETQVHDAGLLTPAALNEAISSEAVGEVGLEEQSDARDPEPATAPVVIREGETGIPLDELMKQRPDPVTSDGTLVRIILGLLAVLLMIAGFFKYALPELMRRYPEFFRNRQEAYEREIAEYRAGNKPVPVDKPKKAGERLLGLASLRKRDLPPEEPLPEANAETEEPEEDVYPLFRQAGIFPALGTQPVETVEDNNEVEAARFEKPGFRLPTLPKITLPAFSLPTFSVPSLPRPSIPKVPEIHLPEFQPPDFAPLRLKAAGVWSTMKKKMEPDPDRYMKQIKDMNSAFDVLYTRNLSRNKALHLVDLWGRHMIIATTPKAVTLLGVMRGEGRDLYFEDLTVDNVKLLGEFARGTTAASYILDFYHEARSGMVQKANRATDTTEEADFDDLYRKYLKEQAVRRQEKSPAPERTDEAPTEETPTISVDVTDWNRPVFPKRSVRPAEAKPLPEPEPIVETPSAPVYRPVQKILQELPQEIYRPADETPVQGPPPREESRPVERLVRQEVRQEETRKEEIRHREILEEVASVIRPRSVDDVVAEHRQEASVSRRDPELPARKKIPRRHPAQMEEVVYLQDYDDEY